MTLLGITPPVVTRAWGREELRKIGYDFPPEAEFAQQIVDESTTNAQIEVDVTGSRIDRTLQEQNGSISG